MNRRWSGLPRREERIMRKFLSLLCRLGHRRHDRRAAGHILFTRSLRRVPNELAIALSASARKRGARRARSAAKELEEELGELREQLVNRA